MTYLSIPFHFISSHHNNYTSLICYSETALEFLTHIFQFISVHLQITPHCYAGTASAFAFNEGFLSCFFCLPKSCCHALGACGLSPQRPSCNTSCEAVFLLCVPQLLLCRSHHCYRAPLSSTALPSLIADLVSDGQSPGVTSFVC